MLIRINKGLQIPLPGGPLPVMTPRVPGVAVHGADYRGLRPEILVRQKEPVEPGQALMRDLRHPEIQVVSPARGIVSEIRMGPRRALQAIVIDTDGPADGSIALQDPAGNIEAIAGMPPSDLGKRLQSAGLWTTIRRRPGDRIALPEESPDAIFITAINSDPYAPPPEFTLEGQWDEFRAGVIALSRFSKGPTWVCVAPGFPGIEENREYGIRIAIFNGPHPAGLPGTHINRLAPLGPDRRAWHIDCQDVAAIGQLLLHGRLSLLRLYGLGGPGITEPALLRVPPGADMSGLVADLHRDRPPFARDVISGSLLGGRRIEPPFEHLGRFHRQVTVTSNAPPPGDLPRALGNLLLHEQAGTLPRAPAGPMLPGDGLDRLWALDGPPAPLLRALMTADLDTAIALGCLDLGEADLSLAALACKGNHDYGAYLREALDAFEREQAR